MKKTIILMSFITMMGALISCESAAESFSIAEESCECALFLHAPNNVDSQTAKDYVETTYPHAVIRYVDIENPKNVSYIKAARRDYKLSNALQVPVICFGNQYIEGWSAAKQQMLDAYVQPYLDSAPIAVNVDTTTQQWTFTVVVP